MAAQYRLDIGTTPFVLKSLPGRRIDDAVIAQDAGRTEPLAPYTLMAKISATSLWVPWTDITAVDGSAIPRGIFAPGELGGEEILAADIVAGDVTDVPIITFGIEFDEDRLVIENSLTLETEILTSDATAVYAIETARDILAKTSLFPRKTNCNSRPENEPV